MKEVFGWTLDQYLYYGGYPGAAKVIDPNDESRWVNYINDSLIETTISRDILLMTQVNKPVLLRRLFQLGCIYFVQTSCSWKIWNRFRSILNYPYWRSV